MILLTGVTGKTGGATAQALLGRGLKFRAIVRNEEKAAALKAAGVDLVVGDMTDAAVLGRALAGVEKALPQSGRHRRLAMRCEQDTLFGRPREDRRLVVGESGLVHREHGRGHVRQAQPRPRDLGETETVGFRREPLRQGAEDGIGNL